MAIVYKHIRLDSNEVFYVGIGLTNKRAFNIINRNKHWKNIVNKTDYIVDITHSNIIWEEACSIEKYLISFYGRKDLELGTLVNMTDGGEGTKGITYTNERRKRISESRKGFKFSDKSKHKMRMKRIGIKVSETTRLKIIEGLKGRKHSEETKLKMSLSKKGSKWSEEQKIKFSKIRKGIKYKQENLCSCH